MANLKVSSKVLPIVPLSPVEGIRTGHYFKRISDSFTRNSQATHSIVRRQVMFIDDIWGANRKLIPKIVLKIVVITQKVF
jgi:hypothetical protein